MLQRNVASLLRQSDNDWQQEFLVDPVGLGIGASYQRLAHHQPLGEWVWILDDDDECTYDGLVGDVRATGAMEPAVGLILVRMDHGEGLGVQPDDAHWQAPPVCGHFGVSSYIVRSDLWRRHAHAFNKGHYASDFDFLMSVWMERPPVKWNDVVASRCQRISRGAPE